MASAILTIGTRWFDIVSSTSWFDFEQASVGAYDAIREAETIAQELRISTNDLGPWHVTAGCLLPGPQHRFYRRHSDASAVYPGYER